MLLHVKGCCAVSADTTYEHHAISVPRHTTIPIRPICVSILSLTYPTRHSTHYVANVHMMNTMLILMLMS